MSLLEKLKALHRSKEEKKAFLQRIGALVCGEDLQRIEALECLMGEAMEALETHRNSTRKLQRILFGPKTEKTKIVCGSAASTEPPTPPITPEVPKPKRKRKGHGRRDQGQYTGAVRIPVPHPTLRPGELCPACQEANLRKVPPAIVLRVEAGPLVTAKAFELEGFRCCGCGKVFRTKTPPEAGDSKYADNVGVMVACTRFGYGFPIHRLAKMQANLGVPLPEGTQHELVKAVVPALEPIFKQFITQIAQSPLVYNDDTTMRVQDLRKAGSASAATIDPKRTGTFTTAIVGQMDSITVVIFSTGWKHAGENLEEVLRHRPPGMDPPIQMCDALSRNLPGEIATLMAHCNSHARREFVDIYPSFPEECRRVLDDFRQIYHFDAEAKEQKLSAEQRLAYHQKHSAPVMTALKLWLEESVAQKRVEPNSGLGKATAYMLKHWEALTLFLRRAGAPLDNNLCERILKMAILHRKNSMSYKTVEGARVGDLFMSIIHTCQLNGVNAYEYLLALVRNPSAVAKNPGAWTPWNYPKNPSTAIPSTTRLAA